MDFFPLQSPDAEFINIFPKIQSILKSDVVFLLL